MTGKGKEIVIAGVGRKNYGGSNQPPKQEIPVDQENIGVEDEGMFPDMTVEGEQTELQPKDNGRWSSQKRDIGGILGDMASDWLSGRSPLLTSAELTKTKKKKPESTKPGVGRRVGGAVSQTVKGAAGQAIRTGMLDDLQEPIETGMAAGGGFWGVVGAVGLELLRRRRQSKKNNG